MDFKKLSENLEIEPHEYLELFELFLEIGLSDLENVQAAFEESSVQKMKDIAHSIKGAAMNLGLTEFSDIARGMEHSARNGQLAEAARIAKMLGEKLVAVREIIQ